MMKSYSLFHYAISNEYRQNKWNVQGVSQSQATVNLWYQEEEWVVGSGDGAG